VTTLTALSSLSGSSSAHITGSGKKRGKLLRTSKYEEEISDGHLGINEKELNSMNKHIPALKGFNPKSATFRQHYYPEGGWGWVIIICAAIVQIFTSGIQLSFGILYIHILKVFGPESVMSSAWVGVLCLSLSFGLTPVLVAFCRRKSTRLTAVVGGLVMALAMLFASFANELHQVMISYGFMFGIGCGMVRETSVLMVSQYFKRRRQNVEIMASMGAGLGLTMFTNIQNELITAVGWRHGLQAISAVLASLFFLGMFYRSASLYHPQRRAILHLKDMSKKKGKDKNKIENKPPYFDFSTLRLRSLQVILVSTSLTSFGAYSPLIYFVPMAVAEGLGDRAIMLQTFIGLGMMAGSIGFGCIVVSRSKQCVISRQYLLQTSIFGVGISILALSSVQGYHGYLLFVWMYGIFMGGFQYVLKMYTFEKIRAKHFPRGWSFVQGARFLPILLGVPLTGYLNIHSGNKKGGYYMSFVSVIIGAVTLFFMDCWKNRHHKHDKNSYCEIKEMNANTKLSDENILIEHENLSQKLSDVHNSVIGVNSVIVSEQDSIKDAETLNQNNNNKEVTFDPLIPYEEEDDDDGHSYHFRGKPELLACISEENLLEQLEIEYLGDITSCNKVENYLMYSEYDGMNYSDDESYNSSNVHSEQITAPINNKKMSKRSAVNHSFSEPDLVRLFAREHGCPPIPGLTKEADVPWQKFRHRAKNKQFGVEMPVIFETANT